nr:threonine/serine exporter family protein [Corynebacterium stercoris]
MRFGMMLLSAGASSYRVIRAVKRCARSLGFDNADVLVGFNTISCTFHHGEEFRTVVADVPLPGVNSSRIEALEDTAHTLLQDYCTAEEVNAALDEIERIPTPRWSIWIASLAAGLACAGFAVLNQFGYEAALYVFLSAAVGQFVRVKLHRKHFNVLGVTTVAAWVASALYLTTVYLLPTTTDLSPGFIAAVLFLIPGFPLFTAFLDLSRFDFTAGIPRLFFALECITVIMLTVTVVTTLSGTPQASPATHEASLEYFLAGGIASFVAVGGFSILFNSSRRMALVAALIGALANLLRLWLLTMDARPFLAAFAAAFVIGLFGSQMGNVVSVPRVTVTVPASVVMIPGTAIYRAVHNFAEGNTPDALFAVADVTLAVLFIAGGLIIARLITDPDWAFSHHINFGKELRGEILPINR